VKGYEGKIVLLGRPEVEISFLVDLISLLTMHGGLCKKPSEYVPGYAAHNEISFLRTIAERE
jgi:hypothetical protein